MRKNQSPAVLNRDAILERIEAGDRLSDIAASYGFKSHSAIVKRLQNDPDYLIAREVGVERRMEDREKDLEVADDSVTVARARDLLSHSRWRAEREFPARWGQHNKLTVENVGDLGDRLRRAKERTVQGERVDVNTIQESESIAQVTDNKQVSDSGE